MFSLYLFCIFLLFEVTDKVNFMNVMRTMQQINSFLSLYVIIHTPSRL